MNDLVAAFGLVLVLEGLLYAMFPTFMRNAMAQMLALGEGQLRTTALVMASIGMVIVWWIRG
ncbi:MAG: hypothetical protein COB59_05915 [Rhodospirillaceae bacterium]|nr:MAG: hypothetical protein COB59_05915 [Rhodospirillaceae bacterium]